MPVTWLCKANGPTTSGVLQAARQRRSGHCFWQSDSLLKLSPFAWTYLLGALALWGISLLGEYTIRRLVPSYRPRFPWAGAALALEWHLVWAAVSGMETIPYALLATTILVLLISDSRKNFGLGLLIGLSVWIRPDGITLLGPAVLVIMLSQAAWLPRLRTLINLALGFGSPFALYLLFNLVVSGNPWPNTLYAKQAEYAVYLMLPFLQRLGAEGLQPLIGAGVILLPGVILTIISAMHRRTWGILAAAAWMIGFLILYAWRLPVTYQHGRYVIPVMPIFFILGLAGLVKFGSNGVSNTGRMVQVFWRLSTLVILMIFWGTGSYAYARDVAVIESEMVATAKWVSLNVPSGTLIAAHDIGALGYYGSHDIVDLAGLINPEVIPFLRDEKQMAAYLDGSPRRLPGCVSGLVPGPDCEFVSDLYDWCTVRSGFWRKKYGRLPVARSIKCNGKIVCQVDLCYTLLNDMEEITIVVVDDHPLFRQGVINTLARIWF